MRRLCIVLALAAAGIALPGAAPAQAALTPAQFEAIDGIYGVFAAFDDDDGATAADRAAARAYCAGLGSADRLLAALRRACIAQLDVGSALGAEANCRGRTACLVAARRVQRAANAYLARSRAANRVVTAAGLRPACLRELRRSGTELLSVARLRNAYAQLERALRSRSSALRRRAQRRIDALEPADTRTVARQREDYRAGCATA